MPAASGTEARSGPKNRPMKMLGAPHFFTKASPRGRISGVARQRPHLGDMLLVFEAEPVGDPIAQRSPDPARNPDRPEVDAAGADQGADRHQRAQAGINNEMKASDSPNASSSTIGAAQAEWSRTKSASARANSSINDCPSPHPHWRPNLQRFVCRLGTGTLGRSRTASHKARTRALPARRRSSVGQPSLFKPIHGIVRGTDSPAHGLRENMKKHAQTIEITCKK